MRWFRNSHALKRGPPVNQFLSLRFGVKDSSSLAWKVVRGWKKNCIISSWRCQLGISYQLLFPSLDEYNLTKCKMPKELRSFECFSLRVECINVLMTEGKILKVFPVKLKRGKIYVSVNECNSRWKLMKNITDWKAAWKRLSGKRFLPRSRKVSAMSVLLASVVPERKQKMLNASLQVTLTIHSAR